jgi:hypothetical protein
MKMSRREENSAHLIYEEKNNAQKFNGNMKVI